jgi:hypothetical protein
MTVPTKTSSNLSARHFIQMLGVLLLIEPLDLNSSELNWYDFQK